MWLNAEHKCKVSHWLPDENPICLTLCIITSLNVFVENILTVHPAKLIFAP